MAKRSKIKRNKQTPSNKYLSDVQLKKLLQYVNNKADLARLRGTTRAIIDEVIILLLVDTGLRASELCCLNIRDLPVEHGENAILVRDAKGNVTRDIRITLKTAARLERFVKLYRKGAKPTQPLLISERGRRLSYMSLYSKVKRIGENAGIGRLHPQVLRRTFQVRLYNIEHDLRFVQNQAGHASPKTTAIYAKTQNQYKRKLSVINDAGSSFVNSADSRDNQLNTLKVPKQEGQISAREGTFEKSKLFIECEGCGALLPVKNGTKIDSGQSLCDKCLEELRKS